MQSATTFPQFDDEFAGKRRWHTKLAKAEDGGRYYSYDEWLEFCDGDEEKAKDLWRGAVSEDDERKKLKEDIEKLDPVTPDQLMRYKAEDGRVILQRFCDGVPATSLRADEDGQLSTWGGAGPRAQFHMDVLAQPRVHSVVEFLVRFQSPVLNDKYLQANGDGFHFDEMCSPDGSGNGAPFGTTCDEGYGSCTQDSACFKMYMAGPLEENGPTLVTICSASSNQLFGTFQLWWAWDAHWKRRQDLLQEANEWVQKERRLQGRRWHPNDTSKTLYSFVEWVDFIHQDLGGDQLRGPVVNGALKLGKDLWNDECKVEQELWLLGSSIQGEDVAKGDGESPLMVPLTQADLMQDVDGAWMFLEAMIPVETMDDVNNTSAVTWELVEATSMCLDEGSMSMCVE